MNKVLVIYPSLFNCYSKFSRKLEKILSSLDNVTLLYLSDPNGFIALYSEQNSTDIDFLKCIDLSCNNATHAVIFDDGEEFLDELNLLKVREIPIRRIKIDITRVINVKTETKYKSIEDSESYEYIGRGGYWGNPHSMYEGGDDRDEVIRKFKYDFDFDKFPNKEKSEVYKLKGKRLGCFCKPKACHGDVLADYLNSWDDGE